MRVLAGIKPTSDSLHLGNYFGALRQFVELQDTKTTSMPSTGRTRDTDLPRAGGSRSPDVPTLAT